MLSVSYGIGPAQKYQPFQVSVSSLNQNSAFGHTLGQTDKILLYKYESLINLAFLSLKLDSPLIKTLEKHFLD